MLEIYQYHVISVYFLPEYGAALPNSKCSVNWKIALPDTSTVFLRLTWVCILIHPLLILRLTWVCCICSIFGSITAAFPGWKWCFNSWMMTLLKEDLPEACDLLAQVCVWEMSAKVCSGESMVFRSSQSNKYKFNSHSYGYAISVEH